MFHNFANVLLLSEPTVMSFELTRENVYCCNNELHCTQCNNCNQTMSVGLLKCHTHQETTDSEMFSSQYSTTMPPTTMIPITPSSSVTSSIITSSITETTTAQHNQTTTAASITETTTAQHNQTTTAASITETTTAQHNQSTTAESPGDGGSVTAVIVVLVLAMATGCIITCAVVVWKRTSARKLR